MAQNNYTPLYRNSADGLLYFRNSDGSYTVQEAGGGDLQDAITAGSTLTEEVVINNPDYNTTIKAQTQRVNLVSGDSEFVNETAELSVGWGSTSLYIQDVGGANYVQMEFTPTTATLAFNTDTKNIARETEVSGSFETVDGKIVTVVNGIITAITPV
jgi:hypothetical protein